MAVFFPTRVSVGNLGPSFSFNEPTHLIPWTKIWTLLYKPAT
jgi:hypothetical protein